MGRISTDANREGEGIPNRGGAILESRIGGRGGKIEPLKTFLALVESDLQRLFLLFCFLCCEFPRNQISLFK